MAFDGIVTKAIASELQNLSGARVDKIFNPHKNNVLLGFYLKGSHFLLEINIDSQNYGVHLTTHPKQNPKIASNFCMVLRKHLLGLHLKNVITNSLERLMIFDFEGFDEVDDIVTKRLIVELMGKHCNIILLNEKNIIIDSLRHINNENSTRAIIPHVRYQYPTITKYDFLACTTFDDFYSKLTSTNTISNVFNGISDSFLKSCYSDLSIEELDKKNLEKLYHYIHEIIDRTNSNQLAFRLIQTKKKDYVLVKSENNEPFSLNFFLDDFYYQKETSEKLTTYRNNILKILFDSLKKYEKRLYHMNEKLQTCANMEIYKLYGELITANLYKIPNQKVKEITLDNYYTNKKINIPLDNTYTPAENAKRFYKKYHKLKNALAIVSVQKEETLQELHYIESIIYELENCITLEEISEIFEEISENVLFKEKTDTRPQKKQAKIKKSSFNPLKYIIDGYTLLVGRNNKENDYLTLKYAKKSDLWMHTKDIHGSHAILLLNSSEKYPDNSVLLHCAAIVAYHSKAKNSSNVPVDICEVKNVKKPSGAKPGMVIYKNHKTLFVNPKSEI